jgi:hypothetical protein
VRCAATSALALALTLSAAGGAAAQTAAPAVAPSGAPSKVFTCTPPGTDLDEVTPLAVPETVLAGLVKSYAAPEVVGLRAAFDRVAAGTADDESKRTMRDVAPALLASRFLLLSDEPGLFGGYWMVIQFREHPEALYRAWIYGRGATSREGPFGLRSWDRAECSPRQQHWLDVRYGELARKMPGA